MRLCRFFHLSLLSCPCELSTAAPRNQRLCLGDRLWGNVHRGNSPRYSQVMLKRICFKHAGGKFNTSRDHLLPSVQALRPGTEAHIDMNSCWHLPESRADAADAAVDSSHSLKRCGHSGLHSNRPQLQGCGVRRAFAYGLVVIYSAPHPQSARDPCRSAGSSLRPCARSGQCLCLSWPVLQPGRVWHSQRHSYWCRAWHMPQMSSNQIEGKGARLVVEAQVCASAGWETRRLWLW